MSFELIAPAVYAIPLGYVNAFAFATEAGLCLVDSGLKGHEKKLLKAVAGMGRSASDVSDILITHHHADHVGALAAMKRETGGSVYIHPIDAPIVAGDQPRPPASKSSILGLTLGPLVSRLPMNHPPAATGDHEVSDGDELALGAGVTVIHTPGHTLGSVSYLLNDHGGVLFAGDAAGHMFGRLGKPFAMFTEDMAQAKESIRKLAGVEFDIACFGHGSVLKGSAHAEFRRYVDKMAR